MATFRKIDVDAFDEDQFIEDDTQQQQQLVGGEDSSPSKPALGNITAPTRRSLAQLEQDLVTAQSEARQFLAKQNLVGALGSIFDRVSSTGLSSSTGGSGEGSDGIKDSFARLVLDVLLAPAQSSTSSNLQSSISSTLKSLPPPHVDLLMKYLYALMGRPEWGGGNVLLQWHEKCFEQAGSGCIIRAMTDRRQI